MQAMNTRWKPSVTVAAIIERERVNFMPGPPTIFQMLLAHRQTHPFDSSSLRGGTDREATATCVTASPCVLKHSRANFESRTLGKRPLLKSVVASRSCVPEAKGMPTSQQLSI